MKRKILLTLFMCLMFLMGGFSIYAEDSYDIKVCLMKAYEDNFSMGNNALVGDAKLYIKDGKGTVKVTFIPLETRGFRGYLGELYVNGTLANVVSTYDEIDEFNDPKESLDPRMQGRKYPKELTFPIEVGQEIINCRVYVPVMGSLGVGEQNARIKITYPEGFDVADVTAKSNEQEPQKTEPTAKSPQNNPSETDANKNASNDASNENKVFEVEKLKTKKGETKYFEVPINLWHAVEDRASMGNGAMGQLANIVSKDGKMTLYIGSSKMTVANITASLINLYYYDNGNFIKTTPHAFDMKVEGFNDLRPEVFSFPLKETKKYLYVMVDPKVEPMGDDPIKARLKIDFENIKEIKKADAKLVNKAKKGKKAPKFDKNKDEERFDKGVSIKVKGGTFSKPYTFYANAIRGEELNKLKEKFDKLTLLKAYELSALGSLDKIPENTKPPINALRKAYKPKKKLEITLPVESNMTDIEVFAMTDKQQNLKFEKKEEDGKLVGITFEFDKFVPFVYTYKISNETASAETAENSSANLDNSEIDQEAQNNSNIEVATKESPFVILFFIILMISMMGIGGYYLKRNYFRFIMALNDSEELKREIYQKQLKKIKEENTKKGEQ